MEKEFVTYELAIKLKELGFDETCCGYYDHMIKELDTISSEVCERLCKHDTHIKAPTFSQSFRWFREKHKLHSGIYPYYDEYEFQIKNFRLPTNTPINGGLMKYEEAELACLTKLIEIIEEKNNLDQNP
jgi:hypothetical protein